MRPVNLIPPDQRQGSQSPLRTGPLPYIVLGGLVALLAGVAMLVTTSNQISESKNELVTLTVEDEAAQEQAQKLAAYVQFQQLHQERVETISSLADSRFDWERVMGELSKILPPDVWLTSLKASASPEASSGGSGESGGSSLRGSIAGPALELNGCADGQDGVAGFITALKEIDGVTRVGVESSAIPPKKSGAESGGSSGGGGGGGETDCRTRNFVAQFQIVVAFDAAPVPPSNEAPEEAAAVPAPEGGEESSSTTTTSTEG
ncbi:MAG: PilN domain-containing protein [Solirubrobacterales bacterium]